MRIDYAVVPQPPELVRQQGSHDPHWIITAFEGLRALAYQHCNKHLVRVKPTLVEGRAAWKAKNNYTRTCVVLNAVGNLIFVKAFKLNPIDQDSPYIPINCREGEDGYVERQFTIHTDELPLLSQFLYDYMFQPTYYSREEYPRIRVSDDPDFGFVYGTIVSHRAKQTRDGKHMVSFQLKTTAKMPNPIEIEASAIRRPAFKEGDILIYKDPQNAAIVHPLRFKDYYEIILAPTEQVSD